MRNDPARLYVLHRLVVVCDRRRELLGSQIDVKVGADSTALQTAGVALVGTNKVTAEADIHLVLGMGHEEDNLVAGSHTASESAVVADSRNSEDDLVRDCTFRPLDHAYCDVSVYYRGSASAWRVAQSRCGAAALDECPRDCSACPEESANNGGDPPNGFSLPVASSDVGERPGNLLLFVCMGLSTFASLLLCVHLRTASREIVILGGGGTPYQIL